VRYLLLVVVLCVSACSSSGAKSDTMCTEDCLGAGGTKELCKSRCEY